MYRAGVIYLDGKQEARNFNTKEEAELWVLEVSDNIKRSVIVNKENIKDRTVVNWKEEN